MKESLDLLKNWLDQKQKETHFTVPVDAKPHHIRVSTVEDSFQPEFLRGLYVLEHAMLDKGLHPSTFTIYKSIVYLPAYGKGIPARVCNYHITFHEHEYNVRRESDMEFLAYFSTLCLNDDDGSDEKPTIFPEDIIESFYQKIARWFKADAF